MCGIIGAVAERPVLPILLSGLQRMEYRGYDSAGVALVVAGQLASRRSVGKVSALMNSLQQDPLPPATVGIAHTRWATHGVPSTGNAHPHLAPPFALVHNGIIENAAELKKALQAQGAVFHSETDTEVLVQWLALQVEKTPLPLLALLPQLLAVIKGSFALAILDAREPERLFVARQASPLLIGVGVGEHFVASDLQAFAFVTQEYVLLEDGDYGCIDRQRIALYQQGQPVQRALRQVESYGQQAEKEGFKHFMLKEIFEQPRVLQDTAVSVRAALTTFTDALPKALHIVACGSSYHAGLVAKYWCEAWLNLPCQVEVASEYRYRAVAVLPDSLFIALSQSGETADTLAALQKAQTLQQYQGQVAICNVQESALVRQVKRALLTKAGAEVSVASTKAFTCQLLTLFLFLLNLAEKQQNLTLLQQGLAAVQRLPVRLPAFLALESALAQWAKDFADVAHALLLARGILYPIAVEGALKLKEIAYIHVEAYPAGELKHGPLALIDQHLPVIFLVADDALLEKVCSNMAEVAARGGKIYAFLSEGVAIARLPKDGHYLHLPPMDALLAPLFFTVVLQLFAYHVANWRGNDIDQPRNLAKAVTVE
jgi:glucosamine--fructose-6-phosphate aminotransferase (isomerizing)